MTFIEDDSIRSGNMFSVISRDIRVVIQNSAYIVVNIIEIVRCRETVSRINFVNRQRVDEYHRASREFKTPIEDIFESEISNWKNLGRVVTRLTYIQTLVLSLLRLVTASAFVRIYTTLSRVRFFLYTRLVVLNNLGNKPEIGVM